LKYQLAQAGFSLIEVCLSIALASICIVVGVSGLLTVWQLNQHQSINLEDDAMFQHALQTIGQDIHGSTRVAFYNQELFVSMADARQFTYYVNQQDQLIRTQAGGGDAVVAAHVVQLNADVQGAMVHLQLQLADGTTSSFDALQANALGAASQ
jgi:prepilin-type N-terminal cleavage/methylation domain-containing protein